MLKIWIIDKWLAGFITGSFFFCLKLYLDLPEEKKQNVWQGINNVFNTSYSLEQIMIVVGLGIIFIILRKYVKNSKVIHHYQEPNADFKNYKIDRFGINKSLWTWNYKFDINRKQFVIEDLEPLCRVCETPMEISYSHIFYSDIANCHLCKLEGRQGFFKLSENSQDIEKEIIRRIETGVFQK